MTNISDVVSDHGLPPSAAVRPPYDTPKADRYVPSFDPFAAQRAYHAKRAEWAKLTLRQDFADEAHMRGFLRTAELRIPDNGEPATSKRLRSLLRRVEVDAPELLASVGTGADGFLRLNPRLPLWAAVALVLESTGRFSSSTVTAADEHQA